MRQIDPATSTFYYCSDDYSQYDGWGGESILARESELVRAVNNSFFVSQPLADRAMKDYGVTSAQVTVSPNATELAFMAPVEQRRVNSLFAQLPALRRPLVGVVGGINSRLDASLLLRVAELSEVSSLLMVGPRGGDATGEQWDALRRHSKAVWVGLQPHDTLPLWMQALDVALIPYRDTPLNHSCSPMRLYDHLAAGRPIVATAHCQQVGEFAQHVDIASTSDDFLAAIQKNIESGPNPDAVARRKAVAREHLWSVRAERIADCIGRYS